ncbi:hypothetical protein M0813_20407 [Anaeramoeba flamelloides]|uniref:Uncharacterized protein n=1 Tax=Anaeramoeba flamelloides TaxID=1746091 RepID=A0ABQ8YLG5_9EUKA|nr:hypothetical protein M0813_20407 [Anaeramoeba flamelloides]
MEWIIVNSAVFVSLCFMQILAVFWCRGKKYGGFINGVIGMCYIFLMAWSIYGIANASKSGKCGKMRSVVIGDSVVILSGVFFLVCCCMTYLICPCSDTSRRKESEHI